MFPASPTSRSCGNPVNAYMASAEKEAQVAAKVLHMRVLSLAVRTPEEIETALASVRQEQPGISTCWRIVSSCTTATRIMNFALEQRLPGVHAYREVVLPRAA